MDEIVPDAIELTSCMFMLHVPDRARGGYPLQASDTASKKQWMSVLSDVIDNIRATPQVMMCIPHTYDYDVGAASSEYMEMSFTSGAPVGVTEAAQPEQHLKINTV